MSDSPHAVFKGQLSGAIERTVLILLASDRFMAASKVLGEETVAGQANAQQQQRGSGGSDT